MTDVKVGQVWRDKDKRSPYKVTVVMVTDGRVHYLRATRQTSSIKSRFVKAFELVQE